MHRDLKLDNVFITLDGRVKILDFGLARNAPSFAPAGQTQLPTRDIQHRTEAGSILGTVGYMSPEQARGEAADAQRHLQLRMRALPDAMRPEFVRPAELDACTAVFFALFHALAGDSNAALDWLEKAVPRGYFNYPFLHTHARFLDSLRGHPRFERLMEVIKERWEEFGKVRA